MLVYPVQQCVCVSVFCIFPTAYFPIRRLKQVLRHAISVNTNGTTERAFKCHTQRLHGRLRLGP